MLPLETKQSGGKLLPHLDLWGGSVSGGSIMQQAKDWRDPDVDGRIILRWIFRQWEGVMWAG
jgi:hypothetical protein